jgi:hypothetical protein
MSHQTAEVQRIKQELRDVGVTSFGMLKFAARDLPSVVHEGEHIWGAVYGRYIAGTGLMKWAEGMLVATSHRIMFVDKKPGFESMDEITYDVVSGIRKSYAWPFSSITLHTRVGDFTLRYANPKCIDTFMRYVEKRRLESLHEPVGPGQWDARYTTLSNGPAAQMLPLEQRDLPLDFRTQEETVEAAVHFSVVSDRVICVLTHAEAKRLRDMLSRHQVKMVLHDQA